MIDSAPPFILFLQETNFCYSATSTPEWENIIGKEGVGNCNQNGLLLLGLCAEHALTITNTLFRMPNRFKTTWRHPRLKHWYLLDYAIIRQPDRKDVLVTRTKPSADDCWTDHRLLITRLRISIPSKPKVNYHPVTLALKTFRYDTSKLGYKESVL